MDLGQKLRALTAKARRAVLRPADNEPVVEEIPPPPPPPAETLKSPADGEGDGPPWRLIGGGALAFLILLWPLLAILTHKIDDDLDITTDAAGGAGAAVMAANLIERQTDGAGWVANAPAFMPAAILNNMPNFQIGVVQALGVFAFELKDQIGRSRGTSAADPDLETAAGLLQYEPRAWLWGQGNLLPRAPAEEQYRKAAEALRAYNARLAAAEATFDRRSDNLLAALDRVALDIGTASAELEDAIMGRRKTLGLLDFRADKVFYRVKGRAYAHYMILKTLETDFAGGIEGRETARLYDEMLAALRRAAALQPLVVNNGTPGGQAFPNHLAAQGFHLLRARARLQEITDILRK